jgi:hypothetical protein
MLARDDADAPWRFVVTAKLALTDTRRSIFAVRRLRVAHANSIVASSIAWLAKRIES